MVINNISQEFRFKSIEKTRNCFIEKIYQNELISIKHKKVCRTLTYIEHLLFYLTILTSAVLGSFPFLCFFLSESSCGHYKFCRELKIKFVQQLHELKNISQ